MSFTLVKARLAALNTLTKYPSIETYHPMAEKGRLQPEPHALPANVAYVVTEKVDGTNVRIICTPDGRCLLGSRENLLWADGDLIGDPAQGIVEGLALVALRINAQRKGDEFQVLYGELYGGKVTAASKQYSGEGNTGFRLFDVATFTNEHVGWLESRPLAEIAAWRESNHQQWLGWAALGAFAAEFALRVVPTLAEVTAADLPVEVGATLEYLSALLPGTRCSLDASAGLRPEGVVVRESKRSTIYKLRFEDYQRTLRAR